MATVEAMMLLLEIEVGIDGHESRVFTICGVNDYGHFAGALSYESFCA
jgi:hypothetical protein